MPCSRGSDVPTELHGASALFPDVSNPGRIRVKVPRVSAPAYDCTVLDLAQLATWPGCLLLTMALNLEEDAE